MVGGSHPAQSVLPGELKSNPPMKIVSRSGTEGDVGDRNGGSGF